MAAARKSNVVHLRERRKELPSRGMLEALRSEGFKDLMGLVERSGLSVAYISNKSGVTKGTLYKWRSGETLRPQHGTMEVVARAIGYRFILQKMEN